MSQVNVKRDVVYSRGGGRELRCDVYSPPASPVPAACVLLLHGGGWSAGDRGMMRDFGERLAAEGLVCVAPEYRLTGESPWPAQIEDVQAAIHWCHSQATELGIDPTKIAAMGFSAGAHLALLAAGARPHPGPLPSVGEGERENYAQSGDGQEKLPGSAGVSPAPAPEQDARRPDYSSGSDPRPGSLSSLEGRVTLAAVVAVYPPVLFYTGETRPSGATPAKTLLGDAATEEAAKAAGPLTYVGPGFPPTFLLHGTADAVVPPSASRVFYDALVRAGVPVELHLYAGQPHGFARRPDFVDLVAAEVAHFLQRQLAPLSATGQPEPAGRGVA